MKRTLVAHLLRFLWGLIIGLVLFSLWIVHMIYEQNRVITTLCAGGSYAVVLGILYFIWLSEETIGKGKTQIRFRHFGYVVSAMAGGIIPFVITHMLGFRN